MDKFSEKSLLALGEYYVYGLIDPRNHKIFYIGKGSGNRVFEHEKEYIGSPNSEKLKLKTIAEIKSEGFEIEKIIINSNLSENEAFIAEASLINALNYIGETKLTNIMSGHHSAEAVTVDYFEKINGAVELLENDIKHNILVIKVNKLYQRNMNIKELYDIIRGVWKINKNRFKEIEYVFGVYNSLIIAVFKPSTWYIFSEETKPLAPLKDRNAPINDNQINRKFFIDSGFENNLQQDENQKYYLYKSIAKIKKNQKSQNPITYIYPKKKRK